MANIVISAELNSWYAPSMQILLNALAECRSAGMPKEIVQEIAKDALMNMATKAVRINETVNPE